MKRTGKRVVRRGPTIGSTSRRSRQEVVVPENVEAKVVVETPIARVETPQAVAPPTIEVVGRSVETTSLSPKEDAPVVVPTPPVTDDEHAVGMSAQSSELVQELLGFRLDEEEYAVEIRSVREIIRLLEITPIPRSPDEILGIVSLRGAIVPIFNVRRRLGLPVRAADQKSRIVVVVLDGAPVGMVVDHVTEVMTIGAKDLESPPATMGEQETAFVTATVRHRQRLIGVLHLERLLATGVSAPVRAAA